MPSKQEILAEIRRTANDNGGKPLGVARFERETGIKEYDWLKYWSRFGDAQKEAGLEANQLQEAHSDEFLVEKLITLARKLGKFPTFREIEVESRSNAGLPSKKTFQRLGGKERIAELVSVYCANHSGFDDVAVFSNAVSAKGSMRNDDRPDVGISYGEVYLLKSGRYYKIGRSNDTVRRGSEIRIQLPEKMTLIHSITTDDPAGVEAYWHRRFESKRMNGEWFDLGPAEIKAFKRWRRIS